MLWLANTKPTPLNSHYTARLRPRATERSEPQPTQTKAQEARESLPMCRAEAGKLSLTSSLSCSHSPRYTIAPAVI